ncbi:MAG TPA: hypothetical protein VL068_10420 [Microthrixaceae bacterium]|nr:hypothetical protein [Microthrixaceae bacterium]
MDKWIVDEDFDGDDAEPLEEDELEEDLDDDLDDGDIAGVDDVIAGDDAVVDKDEDEDEEVPTARRKRPSDVDEDEDEDIDPDDVEADLDMILKDRIAATPDDEEEEDEVVETGVEGDGTERVAAKSAEEFTCTTCFMIVHPRQFGRKGNLTCPEGYSPCSSIAIVEARQKAATKK